MTNIPPASGSGSGLEAFTGGVAEAASGVGALEAQAKRAADSIDSAFERAGLSLTKSLAKAASDGKISLGELAAAAIKAIDVFARSSGGGSGGGLVDALADVFKTVFSGGRADGGPVGAGGAYLVGERGPEVFRPSVGGEVSPLSGGGTTVNVTVQGQGAPAILRSEAQIAAALARAVSLGGR